MSELLHRGFAFSVRVSHDERREADVIASTPDLDAHGEVLDQSTWDLSRYKKNPVVLYGHNRWSFPIGSASNVRVEDERLRATVHFVDEQANPEAERIWQLVKQRALRAVSVGFRARSRTVEKRGGRDVTVLSGLELIELSIVAIPSNPAAVIETTRGIDQQRRHMSTPAKQWHEMTTLEKHALWIEDETKARSLMAAAPTFKGKTWGQMTNAERAECYREDRKTFLAMQE